MAIADSEVSVADILRRQAGSSARARALDGPLLRVIDGLADADFDDVAARVGHDAALRDGLSAWLVSARSRGLLETRIAGGPRQRFTVTPLGRERLALDG